MTEHEIRQHMHRILDSHDQALAAIRAARASMHDAQVSMAGAAQAQDDAIVSAIEAAVSDTLIYQFLVGKVGLDENKAAAALLDFRELRQGSKESS